ncbi:MAG TPA: hypothetical protein VFW66_11070 [Gemmatimonadales bacterium]|nr:hypothetical protein [Gemmatimonadales bacterium]
MGPLSPIAARTATVLASAFLGFDGAAVVVIGVWTRHPLVAVAGLCLFIASGLILVYWRWHRRQLDEIAAARNALVTAEHSLRHLLGG